MSFALRKVQSKVLCKVLCKATALAIYKSQSTARHPLITLSHKSHDTTSGI